MSPLAAGNRVSEGSGIAAGSADAAAPESVQAAAGISADVRLVPAVLSAWVTAWFVPMLSMRSLIPVAAVALVGALVVGLRGGDRWSRRTGSGSTNGPDERIARTAARSTRIARIAQSEPPDLPSPTAPTASTASTARWPRVLAVLLTGVALAAGPGAVHLALRDGSPLAELVADGGTTPLILEIATTARPVSVGGQAQVVLDADAVGVRTSATDSASGDVGELGDAGDPGDVRAIRGRVLIFAPAATWSDLLPGSVVDVAARPSAARPGDLISAVIFARGPPDRVEAPHGAFAVAGAIRVGLRERADAVLRPDVAGLVRGIVLGDTTGMDPILVEDFRVSGLSHLVAVSGTNCAILIAAVLLPLRRTRIRGHWRAMVAAAALAGFVLIVGPEPSVLRAAAMGAVTLIALAVGRDRQAFPALAAAILVLLAIDPTLARSLGFVLSVVATAGIVAFAPGWTAGLVFRRWPLPLAAATAVTAAAGLCTAPVLLLIAPRVSLVSLPANLLAGPVVAFVTVLGLGAALLAPLWTWPAEVAMRLVDLPTRWMIWVAETAARTPGGTLSWPGGLWGGVALLVTVGALWWLLRRRAWRWLAAGTACGAMLVLIPVQVVAPAWPPPAWLLVACDVGQGDALVVRVGPDSAVLIDLGPDPVALDGCLRRLGVTDLPLIMLTHLHADHIGGLDAAVRGRSVGTVLTSAAPEPAQAWPPLQRALLRAGATLRTAGPGVALRIGERARIDVLGPRVSYRGTRSDANNGSLVALISAGGLRILATGDIEVEAQQDLLRSGDALQADVLKVPHHGSAHTDPDFLAEVDPTVALICVGRDNDYGHPDPGIIAELEVDGAQVHRTDLDGDIAMTRDGDGPVEIVERGVPEVSGLGDRGVPAASVLTERSVAYSGEGGPQLVRQTREQLGDRAVTSEFVRLPGPEVDRLRVTDSAGGGPYGCREVMNLGISRRCCAVFDHESVENSARGPPAERAGRSGRTCGPDEFAVHLCRTRLVTPEQSRTQLRGSRSRAQHCDDPGSGGDAAGSDQWPVRTVPQ